MKCPTVSVFLFTMALIALTACSEKPAQAPGKKSGSGVTSGDAASVGTTVPTIVELSDMYVSPETYDLKITVAEVIRGEKSVDAMKKIGAFNVQIQPGAESVLARLRLEYKARGAPGDKPWELSEAQFSAFSEDNKPYGSPVIVATQPRMKPSLRPGDSMECWLVFMVAKSDKGPVMTFNPGGAWFQLF